MSEFFEPFQRCPICDSSTIQPHLELYYWKEHRLAYSRCHDCGAVFANPMPKDSIISEGNEALVRVMNQGATFENEFRNARQAYLRGKLFSRQLKKWKPHGRFLELGCYHGFFSLGIQDHCNWQVEGLEISPSLHRFITERLKITCHLGTLEEVKLPEQSFDMILCHDLIEHINQPQKFLSELSRILKPGGRIQIITPNVIQDLAYAKRAYDQNMPMTMVLNHIMYFSPTSLRIALENAQIQVKKIHCYDVRYALKDFGYFGMGQPTGQHHQPSIQDSLQIPLPQFRDQWTDEKMLELRNHPKVSWKYGWIRETLPKWFTWSVPARLGIGHEIYALGERR